MGRKILIAVGFALFAVGALLCSLIHGRDDRDRGKSGVVKNMNWTLSSVSLAEDMWVWPNGTLRYECIFDSPASGDTGVVNLYLNGALYLSATVICGDEIAYSYVRSDQFATVKIYNDSAKVVPVRGKKCEVYYGAKLLVRFPSHELARYIGVSYGIFSRDVYIVYHNNFLREF